ncbi:MAG: hypothetical protein ACSLE0_05295 [Chitinophagaceae bacterium]
MAIKTSFAQTLLSDTAFYRSAENNLIQLYIDSVKENLHIYNGTEFTAAYRSSAGHPFFEYSEPQKGDIFYDGINYPGVRLSYDLTHDEIIFVTPADNLNIKLISQKVNWFSLQDHLFINIREEGNTVNFPGNGFYELAYDGIYSVLIKRKKYLDQSSREENVSKFVLLNNYYVRKNDIYYTINSKRSLLAVCKDKKSDVAKYMQKENLDFKKDPGNTIRKVIDYYTQLKN